MNPWNALDTAMLLGDVAIHDTYLYATDAGRWFVVGWLFVLGAALGSFLNVVVYRLPLGMSLIWPGSRCPACQRPIRWHDNVPIVGWILLQGRCRDCRAPISLRYPVVEALIGITSALLAWTDAVVEIPPPLPGLDHAYGLDFGLYAYHFLLVYTLFAAALMEYDGHRPPARMLGAVLAVGFVLAGVWPQLRVHPIAAAGDWAGVVDGALALAAALVLAALAWPGWVVEARRSELIAGATQAAELTLAGVFLGVPSLSVVAAVSMGCYALLRAYQRSTGGLRRCGWAAALVGVTLVEILFDLSGRLAGPRFDAQQAGKVFLMAGAAVALLALASRPVGSYGEHSLDA